MTAGAPPWWTPPSVVLLWPAWCLRDVCCWLWRPWTSAVPESLWWLQSCLQEGAKVWSLEANSKSRRAWAEAPRMWGRTDDVFTLKQIKGWPSSSSSQERFPRTVGGNLEDLDPFPSFESFLRVSRKCDAAPFLPPTLKYQYQSFSVVWRGGDHLRQRPISAAAAGEDIRAETCRLICAGGRSLPVWLWNFAEPPPFDLDPHPPISCPQRADGEEQVCGSTMKGFSQFVVLIPRDRNQTDIWSPHRAEDAACLPWMRTLRKAELRGWSLSSIMTPFRLTLGLEIPEKRFLKLSKLQRETSETAGCRLSEEQLHVI